MADLELESWSFQGKRTSAVHSLGTAETNKTWEVESGGALVAQELGSSSHRGKRVGVDHNPQDLEIAEANWTLQDKWRVDGPLQELGYSSSRGKTIHNPASTEVNATMVGARYASGRDTKIVG